MLTLRVCTALLLVSGAALAGSESGPGNELPRPTPSLAETDFRKNPAAVLQVPKVVLESKDEDECWYALEALVRLVDEDRNTYRKLWNQDAALTKRLLELSSGANSNVRASARLGLMLGWPELEGINDLVVAWLKAEQDESTKAAVTANA